MREANRKMNKIHNEQILEQTEENNSSSGESEAIYNQHKNPLRLKLKKLSEDKMTFTEAPKIEIN
jgi:hypothetical protein